jgi:hypothetical protein
LVFPNLESCAGGGSQVSVGVCTLVYCGDFFHFIVIEVVAIQHCFQILYVVLVAGRNDRFGGIDQNQLED